MYFRAGSDTRNRCEPYTLRLGAKEMNRAAVAYALISAALFGLSTPAAKVLVGSVAPVVLAGLLYSGAGIGVAVLRKLAPSVMRS